MIEINVCDQEIVLNKKEIWNFHMYKERKSFLFGLIKFPTYYFLEIITTDYEHIVFSTRNEFAIYSAYQKLKQEFNII